MANTNVFRGSDAAILLSVDQTAEGSLAEGIINDYALTPVGRATGVEVRVETDLKAFHELGQRYPTELRPGNVNITGYMDRAKINGALLRLLLGEAASSRPPGTWVQPSFNIVLDLANPALEGVSSTVTLHGVRFSNWSYAIPEDDFVMEKAEFMALWVSVEDKG
ncbi:hypothetical protein DENIS_2316 [Desulfonema ishimotonii]|uniref:Uncharacterized protein n=1 Tax=Desulfonema ishimotonii TaxID=45657 RepID=A0A401FWL6_9BACT|nr:hypothetical protein [Desulfonema ishimotonii]GBC61356.1 hypothetical protein DENIS_2316 [Desulfonema ishimotonii]